jgi:CO/xanthine dehydrogenase Mo-binding subunit
MAQPAVGTDHPMRDARDRVVGTIRFTVDHAVPGMLHARVVRSPYPHAEITGTDVAGARAVPGVHSVLTGADLEASPLVRDPYFGVTRRDQPALAIGKARYAGEPVAVVLADTVAAAREGAAAVLVDYRELPYVTDPGEAAEPGAPVVHEEWPGNECGSWQLHTGDVNAAFAAADHVHEAVYTSPAASQVPLEPFVAVARWQGDELELWSATQWPWAVHRELARMFGLDSDRVRVVVPPLGGGFGAKGQVKIEPLVACAARLAGRPVRLELDRDEVFLTVCKHAAWMRLRTAFRADGTLLARDIDLRYDAGAYAITSPAATGQALVRAPGPYRIPNVRVRSRAYYTNSVPSGSFRGAMTNQVAFAYESHLDEIAARLGLDPLELRLRTVLRDGDPYATGEPMHDVHFRELLEEVAGAIGWSEPPAATGPTTVRGKGLGVILKSTPTPSRSEARVELTAAGSVVVSSSAVEMGQGLASTLGQLAADVLGVDYERVRVVDPDTSTTPYDAMTAGSRSTFSSGVAVRQAGDRLRQALAELAAGQLEIAAADLRHEAGHVVVAGDPATRLSYVDVLRAAGLPTLARDGVFQSEGGEAFADPQDVHGHSSVHWHQGAVAVEVEVDTETGRVTVVRAHGACWAGRVVNPTRVRQQNEGSMIMGIGPALFEELQLVDGQVTNPNLSDYMIPSMLDVPLALTSAALESADPDAELHGVGEMTIPAVAPAIANAVHRATGVRVRDLPLTPERVLRGLRTGRSREGAR